MGRREGRREGGREEREVRRLVLFETQLVNGREKIRTLTYAQLHKSLSLSHPSKEEMMGRPARDRGR